MVDVLKQADIKLGSIVLMLIYSGKEGSDDNTG
jgi:hypothetical protein